MNKPLFFLIFILFFSSSFAFGADDSNMEGDIVLKLNGPMSIVNLAAIGVADSTLLSIVIEKGSTLRGNVGNIVSATQLIANGALGLGSIAKTCSLEIKDGSKHTGHANMELKSGVLLNIASGVNSNASLCSIVIK